MLWKAASSSVSLICLFWLSASVDAQLISSSGTVNNTVFIIPVNESLARSLVPAQYELLPIDTGLLPGFPSGSFPILVIGGQDYNITDTLGLFTFAQARLHIPFVARIASSSTPYLYTPSLLTDNPASLLATGLTAGTPATFAAIQPPQGSQHALYANDEGSLGFRAEALDGSITFEGLMTAKHIPWPVSSYFTIANFPSFGPLLDTCVKHIEDAPVGVRRLKGTVSLGSPVPLSRSVVFPGVFGVSAVKLFSEDLVVDCQRYAA